MDSNLTANQKRSDVMAAFWPRKVSPYVTKLLLPTSITPNQTTVLWGGISALNSLLVYFAMTGHYGLIPLIPLVYVVTYVLDCVDGEIARHRNIANPVGGKLLDGISHRATEYSLLGAFGSAAWTLTASQWALPITVALLAGDAMQSYVYERRVLILRLHQRVTGNIQHEGDAVYARGTPWRSLTSRQKLATLTGLVQYKSIYPVIAIAYASPVLLVLGLGVLGLYKHWKWVQLLGQTLAQSNNSNLPAAETAH